MSRSQTPQSTTKELSLTGLLGSPRFAQATMVVLGLIFAALVPLALWGLGSGEAAHHVVLRSGLLIALYLLLGAALIVCMARRMRGLKRRIGVEAKPRKRPSHESVVCAETFDAEAARRSLVRSGYRNVTVGEGWAWGVKWRFSPISTIVLHLAVLLGIASLVLGAIPGLQQMDHRKAVVGGAGVPAGTDGTVRIDSLSTVSGAGGTLSQLRAAGVSESGRRFLVMPDVPAFVDPITTVVIEDYDLAPSFSLMPTDTAEATVEKTTPLGLRRNQTVDRMTLGSERLGEYRITMRLDSGSKDLRARIERKQGRLWRLLYIDRKIVPGEVLDVGRARLRYDEMNRWALLRIHRNPQIPLMLLTLTAAVLGACGRLLFPRCEATVAAFEKGCLVTVSVDAYKGSRSASATLAVDLHRLRP